ncbi:hypothetical protein LEP1GSC133_4980 [Leptospira borgpetersenii serovar Pomona str. 200901868]|uniref:Uncharacterized protein n=1 Tax=Leptospira borgpetersenii serovar Pomona str. 200901868 TaxID=1192866 RepID=M6VXF4_LEPBO|nr:hypothetical protein LEP1GSC133_4980 [Leptospira borgpetersenii serovar Pomona str. 200901868]
MEIIRREIYMQKLNRREFLNSSVKFSFLSVRAERLRRV